MKRFILSPTHIILLKTTIHIIAFGWLALTFYAGVNDQLGADPVEALLHFTGIGAFNLLLLSLLVSPAARYFRQAPLIRVRRLLGLYAFFYGLVHFVSYISFELQFDWSLVAEEIIERPYILVGFTALLILTSLAITSTAFAQRKLKRNWQRLHNLVYLAVLLVALHYIWSTKTNWGQPLIYWAFVILLLALRKDKLMRWFKRAG